MLILGYGPFFVNKTYAIFFLTIFFDLVYNAFMDFLIIFLVIINIFALAAMGIDKKKAEKREWRIPESRLFLYVILGGGIGGTLGMFLFRHKTKHAKFRIFFPLITIVEYGALIFVLIRYHDSLTYFLPIFN